MGPVFDRVENYWGKPSSRLIVIRGRGDKLNPFWWTPERIVEIKNDPDKFTYITDFLAEFADIGEAMFTQSLLASISRPNADPIDYEFGHDYVAAMDPATRNNAWTLLVGDRKGRKHRVVYARQWQGTSAEPLRPREVLKEITEILSRYRLDYCYTDQWSGDAMRDLGLEMGLYLSVEDWTQQNKVEAFQSLKVGMEEGLIELPNDTMLLKDLRLTRREGTARGQVSIQFVKTPDGRHCDYSPPLAKLMKKWLSDVKPAGPKPGSPEALQVKLDKLEAKEAEQCARQQSKGLLEWQFDNPAEDIDPFRG